MHIILDKIQYLRYEYVDLSACHNFCAYTMFNKEMGGWVGWGWGGGDREKMKDREVDIDKKVKQKERC